MRTDAFFIHSINQSFELNGCCSIFLLFITTKQKLEKNSFKFVVIQTRLTFLFTQNNIFFHFVGTPVVKIAFWQRHIKDDFTQMY